jgi:hypothetical protein
MKTTTAKNGRKEIAEIAKIFFGKSVAMNSASLLPSWWWTKILTVLPVRA